MLTRALTLGQADAAGDVGSGAPLLAHLDRLRLNDNCREKLPNGGLRRRQGPFSALRGDAAPVHQIALASHRHTQTVQRRLYAVAAELGVSSRELLAYLASVGLARRSASSIADAEIEAAAWDRFGSNGQLRPGWSPREPARRPPARTRRPEGDVPGWWDYDEPDPWRSCPPEVTAAEAARLCGVRPATIRQWASRGYLAAVGRRGRSPLYNSQQLAGAQTGVQDRTRTGPPIRPTVALRSKDLDALLYGAEAAALVGVAPSTIRMWKMRGRLRPVDRPGRPLFRVKDVLQAARRER